MIAPAGAAGDAGAYRAADRTFALAPSWRGFIALTATPKTVEAEAGYRIFQTKRTAGVVSIFGQGGAGMRPIFGARAEVRF